MSDLLITTNYRQTYLSLETGQGQAFCISEICHWSVMSANHDVGLSWIQWRTSNRHGRPKVARPARSTRNVLCQAQSGDVDWRLIDWLSMVLRMRQHNIGYTADGFYRSDDRTNSVKVLKEGG